MRSWRLRGSAGLRRARRASYDPRVLARLALVVPAVLIAVLLLSRIGDERACVRLGNEALTAGYGAGYISARAEIAERVRERCDVERIAAIAVVIAAKGSSREGEGLLREAIRRSPRSFVAWSTLARVQLDGARDSTQARRRARALNPLWRGATPLPDLIAD